MQVFSSSGKPVLNHPLRGRATGGNSIDREEVRRALALLVDPTASVELRGLPSARSRVCSGADLDGLVDAAEELSEDRGVYYTLNPVDPMQLPTGSERAARVADIARRRWFLIDVDPEREPNTNATAAEKLEAKLIADGVGEWLTSQGWPEPVQIDSGNGYHLLYRIDLACTPESQVLLRQCLTVLAQIHDSPGARIDRSVHNASRISKLPGTWARKGTHSPDRPHRATKLLSAPAAPQVVSVAQLQALAAIKVPSPDAETVVETQAPKPSTSNPLRGKATSGLDVEARAVAYLAECPPAISGQGGHGQTMSVARALVWGFGLGVERGLRLLQQHYNPGCQPPWSEKELRHKCEDAETTPDPSGRPRGYLNEEWRPSKSQETGKPQVTAAADCATPFNFTIDHIPTDATLAKAGSEIHWLWKGWLQSGVLTALAAEGGTGKTRFCLDLVRRIRAGLPWPDGQPMTLPADSRVLWVLSDNHHDEWLQVCRDFGIKSGSVHINATETDLYGGGSLVTLEDRQRLEARVQVLRPALVFIDTVGNSTELDLSDQKDAKKYYEPLQLIAARHRTAILCITHLNIAGKLLGRRGLEKVRVAITMDKPDPEQANRRRLSVIKSNSKSPPPLGITMGDHGNEYDDDPPTGPEADSDSQPRRGRPPVKIEECMKWLRIRLGQGAVRLYIILDEAAKAGFSKSTTYAAKERLRLEALEMEGRPWWRLPSDDEVEL